MILYVSDEEKESLLDEMCDRNDWQLSKEIIENDNLNEIIQKQMNMIQVLNYFVLYVDEANNVEELIFTAKTVWNGVRIVLIEPMEEAFLYEDNCVRLSSRENNLSIQLEKVLSGERLQIEKDPILIGVVSPHVGAGATYLSMQIAKYIKTVSDSVCYVEANNSGDLGAYASFHQFDVLSSDCYEKNGIAYRVNSIDQAYEYSVVDFGIFNQRNYKAYDQCKILILISDGMPYRIRDVANVLNHKESKRLKTVLNFIDTILFSRVINEYNLADDTLLLPWNNPMDVISELLEPVIPKKILEPVKENVVPFTKPEFPWKNFINAKKVLMFIGIVTAGMTAAMGIRVIPHLFDYQKQIVQEKITEEHHDDKLDMNNDIRISVMEVDGADGYEVCYSTEESFPKEATVVIEVSSADRVVENLEAGNTYYVRVRAFRIEEDGSRVYGEYTEVQEIKL